MGNRLYHITVKNVETGEIEMDRDSAAFICLAANEESLQTLSSIEANGMIVGHLLMRALGEVDRLLKEFPELKIFMAAISSAEKESADGAKEEQA